MNSMRPIWDQTYIIGSKNKRELRNKEGPECKTPRNKDKLFLIIKILQIY